MLRLFAARSQHSEPQSPSLIVRQSRPLLGDCPRRPWGRVALRHGHGFQRVARGDLFAVLRRGQAEEARG
jgi:hypothetical protein